MRLHKEIDDEIMRLRLKIQMAKVGQGFGLTVAAVGLLWIAAIVFVNI